MANELENAGFDDIVDNSLTESSVGPQGGGEGLMAEAFNQIQRHAAERDEEAGATEEAEDRETFISKMGKSFDPKDKETEEVEEDSDQAEDEDAEDYEDLEDDEDEDTEDESDDDEEGDAEEDEEGAEDGDEESAELINLAGEKKDEECLIAKGSDGKDYRVPKDLTFQKKVNGEMVDVTVNDALGVYSGEEAVKQKLSAVDTQMRKAESIQKNAIGYYEKFKAGAEQCCKLIDQGEPEELIVRNAMIAGKTVDEAVGQVEKFLATSLNIAGALTNLSEPEAKAEIRNILSKVREKIVGYKENQITVERTARERQESQQAFQNHVTNTLKKAQISFDDFWNEAEVMQQSGKISDELSPMEGVQEVIGRILDKRHYDRVKKAVTKQRKALAEDHEFLKGVFMATTEEMSDKELGYIVKNRLKSDKKRVARNLSKKAGKASNARAKKAKAKKKKSKGSKDETGPVSENDWMSQFDL